MNLPFFFASRYLFARKSHNVINIISAISAAGMAIGTAAMVIILSVYNGFDSIVKSMLNDFEADLVIKPSSGKVFVPEGETYDWIYEQESVRNMCCVLQENVFIDYDGRQGMAVAKGVDWIYEEETPLRNHIRNGEFRLSRGDVPMAVVGTGLASAMDINPRFVASIDIFYPSRTRNFSVSNPASSLESISVWPAGTFSVNTEIDSKFIIVGIEKMRELLEYEEEVSAVELRMNEGYGNREVQRLKKEISRKLGPDYVVCDRFEQNEALFKMMQFEKLSIFLILGFIIIIVSFSISGAISMLIIEKKNDIATLKAIGADSSLIRKIFTAEGWLISLSGMAAGLVAGIAFTLLQQHFGFIKMPGNFLVEAYPVILEIQDLALTAAGVSLIGFATAKLPVMYFCKEA